MNSGNEPLWLVPQQGKGHGVFQSNSELHILDIIKEGKKSRERLRSIGPVVDLSRQSLVDTSCLSQSLSQLDHGLTPVAAVAPLNKNNNPLDPHNNPLSEPNTPVLNCHNYSNDDETTSLPDEIRHRSVSDSYGSKLFKKLFFRANLNLDGRLPSATDYDPDPAVR